MAVSLSGMTLHTNNDNETNWAGTDGPDTYNKAVQGSNSESWNVAKNTSETGTLTKSATMPTTRGIFTFWMASDLSFYYTSIDLELQSSASNYKNFECANSTNKAIGGDFVPVAVDYVNKGTATGTYAPASHTLLRVIVDNSSSGNIRAVINNWIDAMYFGPGHTISGTTTGDKAFAEAAAVDENASNKYGVMWSYNGIIYSQGDLDFAGTALTSDGEVLVFVDTVNGYDTYNCDITGTVTFTNSTIIAAGTIDYNFDSSGATSFTMTGGSLAGYATLVTASGQTMSGIVFQDGGTATIANTVSDSAFNLCGQITVSGVLDSCTINKSTAAAAVSTTNLNKVAGCHFISDGTGHAVDLGTVSSTTSMTWSATESGYASSDGSTGNETIKVNVAASQTLTISVQSGASTPTIYNTGTGTVDVQSGLITVKVVVRDNDTGSLLSGARVRLVDAATKTTVYLNDETDGTGAVSTDISYSSDVDVVGWVRQWDLSGDDYVPQDISGTITSSGLTINVRLDPI